MTALAARHMWSIVALLAYGVLALVSGIDRLAAADSSLSRLVPAPMRAELTLRATGEAIANKDAVAANRQGSAALAAMPADGRSVGLYLAAQVLDNNPGQFARGIPVARMAGVREPLSLALRVEHSLKAGHLALAVREMEALLRTDPQYPGVDGLLRSLVTDAAGRRALAARLAAVPQWTTELIARDSRFNPGIAPALTDLLLDGGAFARPLGCAVVRLQVERLLAAADRRTATAIWQNHCPDARVEGPVVDPHFRQLAVGGSDNPFGWRRIASGDVTLSIEQRNGRTSLRADNSAAVPRKLLEQAVDLAPGRYAIALKPAGKAGQFELLLHCASDPDRIASLRRSVDGIVTATPECSGQTLAIWLAPKAADGVLEGIEVQPVN